MVLSESLAVQRVPGPRVRRVPRCIGLALCALALGSAWAGAAGEEAANDPALEGYYAGNALYNRKLYSAAAPEYRSFLGAYPQHPKAEQARLGLALSCYQGGNFSEAGQHLRTLIQHKLVGDQAQLMVLLGECQLKLHDPAEAVKTLAAAAQAPGAVEFKNRARASLVEALCQQEQWAAAAAASDDALRTMKTGDLAIRAAYQGAYARYHLKNFSAAAQGLDALLPQVKGTPLEGQVAFLLAESRREAGDLAKAAEAYLLAARNKQDAFAVEAAFRLGSVCFHLKKYEQAVEMLSQALQDAPGSALANEAHYYLGRTFLEQKEFARACNQLRPVAQGTNDFSAVSALWMGRAFSRQGQPGAAAQVIADYLPRVDNREPLLGDLLFEQANALIDLKRTAEATAALTRIERACPDWPELPAVLRLNAFCLHWEKKYTESLQRCERLLAARPHQPDTALLFLRAENLYLMNPQQADAVLKQYQEFVAAYPQDPKTAAARLRITQILHRQGQWAAALQAVAPLVQQAPAGPAFSQVDFIAGDCAFRLEDWDQAIARLEAFLKKAVRGEPNLDTARIELALAGARTKNKADLTATNLSALVAQYGQSPHLALALAEQGKLQYENKQPGEARRTLQRIVSEFPQSPQRTTAEYYLGWLALDAKQYTDALNHFRTVVGQGGPLAEDSLLQLGLMLLRAENYTEALVYFNRHSAAHPNSAKADEALYSAGVALAHSQQAEAAISRFRTLLEKFPQSPLLDRGVYEWAWAERARNNKPGAIQQYEVLLQKFPGSTLAERARFELSELTFDAKDFEKVLAQLKASIATAKDPAVRQQSQYRLAWAYLGKNDPAAAAKEFEAFVTAYSESDLCASAYYQAGECRIKTKEFVLAAEHFAAALKAKNSREVAESALLRLGEAQGLLRQWADSAATYAQFQRAYPASPWLPQARLGAGWAYENGKKYPEALREYGKALADKAQAPTTARAHPAKGGRGQGPAGKGADEITARCQFQIGECLFAQGKLDEAIRELVRVEVSYPFPEWSARALVEIGRVLEAKGDQPAAVAQFKEVIRKYPGQSAAALAKERLDALRATM
ncbi:MAG: tetratricopeptide repeat protein [Kiritimatiellaeota bacterium]|nr:tetratricopeptide repeat protein [Kiritimatiellota bacterium]